MLSLPPAQFLDPLLLMSEVKRESGRRISFLTAAKSMDRAFVGLASRLMQSSASSSPYTRPASSTT